LPCSAATPFALTTLLIPLQNWIDNALVTIGVNAHCFVLLNFVGCPEIYYKRLLAVSSQGPGAKQQQQIGLK
jgi:hypothetical protein